MSRTSKRIHTTSLKPVGGNITRQYRVGIYVRLSSDRDESKNDSAETQIAIAKKHIAALTADGEKMDVCDVYRDMGKTGSNFTRDEFARLMQDIRMGEINCIVVKDLSRFGRNYLEAGNYIEKIFPFLGVRFIAVSDGFDTGQSGNEKRQMSMNIKNLVNDMYAKDFSKKAKLHLQQRRDRGSYVGGPTPYGYTYRWVGKDKKLIVDQTTKPILEMIFDVFVHTKSYMAVARHLNAKRIHPPAIFKKTGEVFCGSDQEYKGWDKSSIERILTNTVYVGILSQGKTSCYGRDEANRVSNRASDWTVVENSHEGIISKEDFEQAQIVINEIREKSSNRNHNSIRIPLPENIFDNVLFCGLCGRKMTRHSYVKVYENGEEMRLECFACMNAYTTKSRHKCESNRISKEILTDILFSALQMEFKTYLEKPDYFIERNEEIRVQKKKEYQAEIVRFIKKIEQMEQSESRLYMRYREGAIEQDQYVKTKLKNGAEKEALLKQQQDLEECIHNLDQVIDKLSRAIKTILQLKQPCELTKEFVNSLVEKIYVFPGKRVEIVYSFTNERMGEFI